MLEGLDVFGRLNIAAVDATTVPEGEHRDMVAMTEFGALTGFALFAWLTAKLPFTLVLLSTGRFPGACRITNKQHLSNQKAFELTTRDSANQIAST